MTIRLMTKMPTIIMTTATPTMIWPTGSVNRISI